MYNCAMKVKSYFEDVNHFIAKIKSERVKIKTRQDKLATVDCLPHPVVTRWGSWLNAALNCLEEFT